jgi:hypothetical protein
MSSPGVGASVHSRDPAPNPASPSRNSRLRPYRSPSAPPASSNEASTIAYADSTHCCALNPADSSAAIAGNATFGAVTLNSSNAEARHTTANVHRWQRRAPSVVSPGGRAAAGTSGWAGHAPNPAAGISRPTPRRRASRSPATWSEALTTPSPPPGLSRQGDYTLARVTGQPGSW